MLHTQIDGWPLPDSSFTSCLVAGATSRKRRLPANALGITLRVSRVFEGREKRKSAQGYNVHMM